ncbi:protein translocase subunit SecD [bacterium]|nr:protein translocase subunit SecD [FCB group bacterium]MBL7191742.1 protein translocase subunit SecD [bacterium]
MKKRKPFRTILILFFIALAVYYILPTFRLNKLEDLERVKIQELAGLTGIELSELYYEIYREDTNILSMLYSLNLPPDTLEKSIELVDYLQTDLNEKLVKTRGKSIKLGLDLRGGMYIVLEVDLVKMIENLARDKDELFDEVLSELSDKMQNPDADFYSELTNVFDEREIPLNRYFGDLRDSRGDILNQIKHEAEDAINRSLEILRNRIDQFGVSEPTITKQGGRRIVVELPGVQDPARARTLIGKTALLEFKLLAEPDRTQKVLVAIDVQLKKGLPREESGFIEKLSESALDSSAISENQDSLKQPAEEDTIPEPLREAKDKAVTAEELFGETGETVPGDTSLLVDSDMMAENPFLSLLRNYENNIGVPEQNYISVNRILHRPDILALIPPEYEFLWSNEAYSAPDGNNYYKLYLLKKEAELTGSALRDAGVIIGSGDTPGAAGQPIVSLQMNREGSRIFARVTGANEGKFLSIVLDNKVHMAPRIKTKIRDGSAIIEGSMDMAEARDLAIILRAGALPAPVEIIQERTIGPSLGRDSLAKGSVSAAAGLILVALFIVVYYRVAGMIAFAALVLNMLFVMSVLAGFSGTLTLPGIAGIILTIGMAVDANVLIYERIREELRSGKTIRASIEAGYSRAIVTILDANVTTLISAVVLFQFGTGPLKGFALTLMIGIIASMFTAIVVTRSIFDYITYKYQLKTLKI